MLSLPSAASYPAFIVVLQLRGPYRQIANIVNALKGDKFNIHCDRVGVISLFSCCRSIHDNNLREEAD